MVVVATFMAIVTTCLVKDVDFTIVFTGDFLGGSMERLKDKGTKTAGIVHGTNFLPKTLAFVFSTLGNFTTTCVNGTVFRCVRARANDR